MVTELTTIRFVICEWPVLDCEQSIAVDDFGGLLKLSIGFSRIVSDCIVFIQSSRTVNSLILL